VVWGYAVTRVDIDDVMDIARRKHLGELTDDQAPAEVDRLAAVQGGDEVDDFEWIEDQ
jgi:hypothetical protein